MAPGGRRTRLRAALGRVRTAADLVGGRERNGLPRTHLLGLDYPPTSQLEPRWGHGRADHPRIAAYLARFDDRYAASLDLIAGQADALLDLPVREAGAGPGEPAWVNRWLPGLDTAALYAFTRGRSPARIVEVGSGASTRVVARAIRDGGLATRLTSIDPAPRSDVDALCDDVVRAPLEAVGATPFAGLERGDIVFFDGSHRVFMNSDTTIFVLDVLPELPPGVLVGIHDILLPADYLPEWRDWWFAEQYLIGALLLGEPAWIEPVLASAYVSGHAGLSARLDGLLGDPRLAGVDRRGFALWLETQ
jgi:hypothetical protein